MTGDGAPPEAVAEVVTFLVSPAAEPLADQVLEVGAQADRPLTS